jgi:hypothetical protein
LILRIRGQRVIVDADLANLYGVSTKQLNQQIKRNLNRFPLINIFIILTVFSLSTFASAETYMPNGFKYIFSKLIQYHDQDNGFSLTIPSDWEKKKKLFNFQRSYCYGIERPAQFDEDYYDMPGPDPSAVQEDIVIYIENLSSDSNVDSYFKTYADYLKRFHETDKCFSVNLLKSGDLKDSKYKSKCIVYDWTACDDSAALSFPRFPA